jgi:RNA polymerase sigma-70 factor (ECF subfamily)
MEEDLSALIHKAQSGDTNAFGRIYELFYKRIYRYLNINLGSPETAQDLCQETFLSAWRNIKSFSEDKGGSLQAYLFRIARNKIIDLSRKKKEISLEVTGDFESKEDILGSLDKEEDIEMVRKALSSLEEVERQIIVLRYFEELSTAEVAQAVGFNEGALRVRLHRILKKLKENLNK